MKLFRKWFWFLLVFLLPVILILPTAGQFHYAPGSKYSDIAITHYPNMLFIQNAIFETGSIPLWNPNILSGYPFDADPLSGLWYPPGWLAIVMPLPLGINIVVIIHLILGGVGLYKFLRKINYDQTISLIGAGLFMVLPKIYAHFGAGHITLIFAFSIIPWLMLFGLENRKPIFAYEALCIGGMVLADIRMVPYGLIAWIGVSLLKNYFENSKQVLLFAIRKIIAFIFGVCLSACLLLPFMQYTQLSTRSLLTTEDNLYLSLPPENLINLLFGTNAGSAEWIIYTGTPIVLLGLIIIFCDRNNYPRILAAAWLLCVLWSLGSFMPFTTYLVKSPFISLLRVPPRVMLLGNIITILIAVEALKWFKSGEAIHNKKWIRLISAGMTLFTILIATVIIQIPGSKVLNITLGIMAFLFTVISINIWNRKVIITRVFISLALCFTFVDLIIYNTSLYSTVKQVENNNDESKVIFNQLNNGERIYSPSYSIPQEEAIRHGWYLAQGIHPMQIRSYVEFLAAGTGVDAGQYSVIQPPLATGSPDTDNMYAIPNLEKLARLNIAIISSEYPIQNIPEKNLIQKNPFYIYSNPEFDGYPQLLTPKGYGIVETIHYSPNKIKYNTQGEKGILQTSEILYPGWTAKIDGRMADFTQTEGLFRNLELSAGAHKVIFAYTPQITYIGICITIITLIFLIFTIFTTKKYGKQ